MYTKSLDKHINEMKMLGNVLIPYNFPIASIVEDDDLACLKFREITLDGYSLIVYYNKADWGTHYLETLQVIGKNCPFLPFSLVCKIAKKFLGNQFLSFIGFIRDDRKVYCWTLTLNKNDKPTPALFGENDVESCNYEGFEYLCLNPDKVNFY